MQMDSDEYGAGAGPSSSFQYRGRGGGRGNSWRGGGRGGRGYDTGYQGGYQGRGAPRGGHNGYSNYNDGGFSGYGGADGGGGGGGRGRSNQSRGRGSGYWGTRGAPPRGGYRGGGRAQDGQLQMGGRAGPGPRRVFDEPEDVEFVRVMKGHSKHITTLAVDHTSSQLYSGSADGSVRVWDLSTGQCTSVVDVGGEVDSLLLEGGFLFVGLNVQAAGTRQGLVKVWNMASGEQHELGGCLGQVLALTATHGMLIAGGQDRAIRVWKLNPASQRFEPQVEITAAQGGHGAAVQALLPVNPSSAQPLLLSADWEGALKVWDMHSGACVQTLPGAHGHVVMGMLQWEGCVLTCALDGTVKVWQIVPDASREHGALVDPTPVYVHPPEDEGAPGRNTQAQEWGGVLALAGGPDAGARPVLLTSHNDDGCVRLWDLPSFGERGHLPSVRDARALAAGPGGLLMSGDNVDQGLAERDEPVPPYGVMSVLAAAGFLETAYLTASKLLNTQVVCPASGSCDTVLTSGYAEVFGVPLSLFGMLGYGAVAALAAREFAARVARRRRTHKEANLARYATLAGGTVLASTSGYLLYILATRFPGDSCTWCFASAALSAAVFGSALRSFSARELTEAAAPGGGLAAATVLALALAWANVDPPSAAADFELPFSEPEVMTQSTQRTVDLARRLRAAGARFYGAFWCSHCFEQKEAFGAAAAKELPYVECYPDGFRRDVRLAQECVDARLTGFPAWTINGRTLSGERTLDQLEAELRKPPAAAPALPGQRA
ncbi:hypothetical protein WJX81_007917 [Elliptochloris bilobata]|uniref:Vitamin K epoxide reductase domain-containing protein n=1 Tax=Elliptochloris bilobata TaxID=381761 RepID=A0AAW1S820_9CHLO